MSREIINTLLLAGSFLILFGLAELLYYKGKVKVERTRKIVHLGTGMLTLLFPIMLNSHWYVLILCASFALILIASLKFDLLKSINAIDRVSYGSLWYPLAVYACYLVYHFYTGPTEQPPDRYLYFYAPILTLAICDPIAALAGKKIPYGRFRAGSGHKTLTGSFAFFISSFLLIFLLMMCFDNSGEIFNSPLLTSGLIAGAGTFAEAISSKGADNLTIPLVVILLLTFLS